ncbi:hypothetical protein [Fibrella aquatica]|uniref:hypothetical protein n=1 Tax=Fibrella aquatica TaxID=3242487 RepID=UPI003521E7DB
MPKMIKLALILVVCLSGGLLTMSTEKMLHTKGAEVSGPVPAQVNLTPTPRSQFTPTTRKGYWNANVVGDFTLPKTKSIVFSAAGRNLYLKDWSILFRRGFSAIDRTRMVFDTEIASDLSKLPRGWKSRLTFEQRADAVGQHHFRNAPFNLAWAGNSELAPQTSFRLPPNARGSRETIYSAIQALAGSCEAFGDCPNGVRSSGYSKIFFDIENDGISAGKQQEQANLYTYFAKATRDIAPDVAGRHTEIGGIAPNAHNGFGYSRANDYNASAEWLFTMPAKHTATSRQRGMPDEIVGKSYSDYVDFHMPGTYFYFPDFDYAVTHNADAGRHWLAGVLSEQEYNIRLTNKKRIAYHWVFNTQGPFYKSEKASNPAPPAVAEGLAVFYWFTGAAGAVFWDDVVELTPDQPTPTDPAQQGISNDRVYACYEHYIHGLWRLFKHHGDLFNGKETYLNQQTECSFDGGRTWYKYNANELKTRKLPFARAIVNGNQILIAATMPYAKPGDQTSMMVRYVANGSQFYTTINLKGDEIYLGRATL